MDHSEGSEKPLMGTHSESGQSPSSELFHLPNCECAQTPRRRSKWPLYLQVTSLAITILSWASLLVLHNHYRTTSPFALIDRGNCGWSVAEAKANNCVYDIMMSSWMPRPCYDEELSESFLRVNNFTYWRKNDGKEEVSEEEVRKGEFDILFTHGTYHAQHCIYLWKLQMKAQKSSVRVLDSISRSQAHIAHCQKLLTMDPSGHHLWQLKSKTGTPIHVKPQMQSCWEG